MAIRSFMGRKRNCPHDIPFAAECAVRQRTEQCIAEADPKAFVAVRLEKVKTLAGCDTGSTSPADAARRLRETPARTD